MKSLFDEFGRRNPLQLPHELQHGHDAGYNPWQRRPHGNEPNGFPFELIEPVHQSFELGL